MKTTRAYWIIQIVLLVLFFLPWYFTHNSPAADGAAIYGFPLPYKTWGGFCNGGCEEYFSWKALVVDLIIIFGIPLAINYFVLRRRNKRMQIQNKF